MLKQTMISLVLVAQVGLGFAMNADSMGQPGDHFSLEAALDLFKESSTPEDFEKRINQNPNGVNNLDLNQDGRVDFLRVKTGGTEDDRMLVITAVLGKEESHDVAVIEIARQGKEQALIQIVGDEDLFGSPKVVEPFEEEAEREDKGPNVTEAAASHVWVNVWFWPCVTWFYGPGYMVYVAPWYWDFYPVWWTPWPPCSYVVFYGFGEPYHHHYHQVHIHRTRHIHQSAYLPRRERSSQVAVRFKQPNKPLRENTPARTPRKGEETPPKKPRQRDQEIRDQNKHPEGQKPAQPPRSSQPRSKPR